MENSAIHYELLTFLLLFWEMLWSNWNRIFCLSVWIQMKQMRSLCLQFLFAISWLTWSKMKFMFCKLFLEISQHFEIFKWQTVSLLTKVVLGKKVTFNLQMEHLWSFVRDPASLFCKARAVCPGRPARWALPLVGGASSNPLKQSHKNGIYTQEDKSNGKEDSNRWIMTTYFRKVENKCTCENWFNRHRQQDLQPKWGTQKEENNILKLLEIWGS